MECIFMGKIGIIADTACDLTNELCEKHNIERIPFYVNVNGKEYLSGKDITVEELFKFSRENKSIPKTSQITIVEFTKKFKEYSFRIVLVKGTNCFGTSKADIELSKDQEHPRSPRPLHFGSSIT